MATTEYWGTYLGYHSVTENSFTVTWSSMEQSGNPISGNYYNIEIWQPDDGYDGTTGENVYRFQVSLSARSYYFGGLKPGTKYMAKLYVDRQNDRAVDRLTIWTAAPSYPVPATPSLSLSVTNRRNFIISGNVGANTDYLNVYVNGTRNWVLDVRNSSNYSVTYYGSYSTRYNVTVEPTNSYHTGGSASSTITTLSEPLPDPPPAPTNFNIYNQGESWASFAWNSVSTADRYAMEIWRGSSRIDYDYNITTRTKQFTGLSPGIDYQAKLYAINAGGNGTPTYLNFRLGYDRPANFSWTIAKANNSSYNRNSLGQLTNFMTAQELQNFQARINAFRRYKGLSEYTFTIPAPGQVFTASMYNQLRTAISNMNPPTSVPSVGSSGSGDTVNRLNGLVSSLNSIS